MISSKIRNWLILPAVLAGGIVLGLLIPLDHIRDTVARIFELKEGTEETEAHEEEGLHVDITETAQKSLGLKVRRVETGTYSSTYEIPATVRALPGADSIPLASRYSGMVKRVFVSEGQSVRAGDPVYELELTGEVLSRAQSALLLAVNKKDNLQSELDRLAPLVQQGGLANKRSLELQYEKKQLNAEIETRTQELLLMGLGVEGIRQILEKKELVRNIVVRVPEKLLPPQVNLVIDESAANAQTFIVERLTAKTGSVVDVGEQLCELAFHEVLIVEGHAFEKDLDSIRKLISDRTPVAINVGSRLSENRIGERQIAFLANHAKSGSNTYPFFVYLFNEAENPVADQNSSYKAWKWKPGQLGHVELSRNRFEQMLIVPRAAIAEDGVSRMVFEWKGQVEHDHEGEEHDHEHADEFVPVEVNVLYMNREVAVIDPAGKLKAGTKIAFNSANQLLFAMQSGSGGHGHDHGHSH